VANSLAAVTVGLELDVAFPTIVHALEAFRGVDRRLQIRGEAHGAMVIDDYGHHPTEIRATLEAVRTAFDGRLLVAFQPHRYSRTESLLQEFGASFGLADVVVVTDIYAAGERPVPGLDGSTVAHAIRRHGHPDVHYEPDKTALPEHLRPLIEPGDVVLTLGAGDVWRAGEALVRGRPFVPKPRGGGSPPRLGEKNATVAMDESEKRGSSVAGPVPAGREH
jgi:UDP-N-acetylmuramate--alanine ligase